MEELAKLLKNCWEADLKLEKYRYPNNREGITRLECAIWGINALIENWKIKKENQKK